jgi:hypothetical protein
MADLVVRIIGDTASVNQALKGLDTQVAKSSKSLTSMGVGLAAAAGVGVLGLATSALSSAANFVQGSIEAASSFAESMNKMQVVFGDASTTVETFAKTSASNLGMSQQKAIEAAGTFGNLFMALGLGKQPAADMSTSLLQLAADLASFNNIRPEEALEKLRSGLVGEAEPMRALGVNINETVVKAQALKMGLAGASGELSEAAKVQARYALIMQQTSLAQGDFARTADGAANATRIQQAKVEDLQATIGIKLLPVQLAWVNLQGKLVDGLSGLGEILGQAGAFIGDMVAQFQGGIEPIQGFTES